MPLTYWRSSKVTAKGRWFGRALGDIVPQLGPGAKCDTPEHIVQQHDVVEYMVHMHEPPAPSPAYSLVAELDDYIVIDKASGIPTHPTVNYFHNTITELLRPTFGNVHPCFRLDRLTSGILVLAKTAKAASAFQELEKRKVYYARVAGQFVAAQTLDWPLVHYNSKRGYKEFKMQCKEPKDATTIVEPVAFSESLNQSVVKCTPVTGRTHQIRRHLAIAGHPIVNDELYSDGLYKALYTDPTEQNFDASVAKWQGRKQAKATGEHCPECGTDLFHETLEQIWLHCASYSFGGNDFETTRPAWIRFE